MGGARCSYRTCTVRSDSKLHMFHYPVFDKIRCHQWMINAQRLNFLDLKLSQLKNRVICEHHFTDDSFMNVTRAKLKNSAVPTEDGPFCVKSTTVRKDNGESPVILDDIENENLTTLEKQAHFSVKYADFLINDVREPSLLIPKYYSKPLKLRGIVLKSPLTKRVRVRGKRTANSVVDTNVSDTTMVNAVHSANTTLPNPLSSLYENKSTNPECRVMAIEFEHLNLNRTEQSYKPHEILPANPLDQEFSGGNNYKNNIKSSSAPLPSSKKVKIISEKKISEPVLIKKSELEPVSPSFVLRMPDKKKNLNAEMNSEAVQTFNFNMFNSQQRKNIQEQTLVPNFQDTSIELQAKSMALNKVNSKHTSHIPRSELTDNSVVDGSVSDTKGPNAVPSENIIVPDSVSSLYQNKSLPNPMVMAIEFEELNLNTAEQTNKHHEMLPVNPIDQELSQASVVNIELPSALTPSSKKVKIISGKNISDPVLLKKSELEPASSPSVVLRMNDRKNLNAEMNELGVQTFYFNITNSQQGNNIHELDNITSQPSVTNQMCLTEYANPKALVDQMDNINNSEVTEVELPMKLTASSGPAHNDLQLKQESEQLTNLNLAASNDVPTTSKSVTEQGKSFSIDLPLEATHSTNLEYVMNFTEVPIEVQKGSSIANTETQILSNSNKFGISKIKPRVFLKGPNNRSPKNLSKIKMPPEKAAAIIEKRKFNMKLRDIIDSCLNKLDEEPDERNLSAAMKRKLSDRNVGEHLTKHPDLPSTQENNIAYFEARLQRMENTLLNKIEQNTQKIIDLKKAIKPLSGTKSVYTQTYFDAEATKKQLYQQISQFLSPEANNLVYEELFINNMISNIEPAHKKRKGSC